MSGVAEQRYTMTTSPLARRHSLSNLKKERFAGSAIAGGLSNTSTFLGDQAVRSFGPPSV
ncbi:hypothetical protein C499_03418 [Halogeometricum borinquense DSM 11551]|uniref:Uncharacterized protein n=2 Tax=Halogeometricum borinquense TaxID=60847 RepID=E4NR39_HALBP|nr:hypothetical protein [Halogeometricum borinquense]ADQ66775.1 hypothetical protein Hbor_11860 [Halogeometricum borinquense DSM 11551]ELY30283.1 hypothetical protein C499_03418 [Halogeometricum borinquense DSM 11551]RYJ14253.1 hypothetical protein ELS19_09945 [Halogeometricum borinquense]